MPTIHHHIATLQETLKPLRQQQSIALVPTMGNLHQGHLELVRLARQHADIVVVSIFVNPTQFGVGEDFDSYPRTLDEDIAKLTSIGVDYVFAPSISEIYPVLPPPTLVMAGAIATQLCGQSRPTHFDGVGIVVAKLFNIIQPDSAIFGQKDYQQLAIIKQLVRDLSYPIEIIGAPIVRADDGLALSSRNQYLTDNERQIAPSLQAQLKLLASQLMEAKPEQKVFESLIAKTKKHMTEIGFDVDYLEVKTAELTDLSDIHLASDSSNTKSQQLVILVAARLGRARLLDNQLLTIKSTPQ
ncbi:pantoate--beta-alanine ligase [Psychrobacter sp. M13]|uniref:pantoate--beta-alanine ligase n=1 Tax=Psychrobacter sp. M13 TaxID=3067275 RepID=UPI00273B10F6|nr:pantoate--beta-alanine ligase [Psychrobacter sp. M13]WLP94684.1 pantoate--beta-alanine ligase [Psychrobacter sp. M13]